MSSDGKPTTEELLASIRDGLEGIKQALYTVAGAIFALVLTQAL